MLGGKFVINRKNWYASLIRPNSSVILSYKACEDHWTTAMHMYDCLFNALGVAMQ